MSKASVGLGIGVVLVSALLLGSRKRGGGSVPERIEAATYRGFRYVIDRDGAEFEASIPPQDVGQVAFAQTQTRTLSSLADARAWIHATIDAALSPSVRAIFVGAQR